MTDPTDTDNKASLLHPELSYKLRGTFFSIANLYGLGHREKLYHNALIDQLLELKIPFEHEKQIPIYSWRDGRKIGIYIPDFIINNIVIVELKSEPFISKQFMKQIQSYLRISPYELAFLVNFGDNELTIKRLIFTNDRKPYLNLKK